MPGKFQIRTTGRARLKLSWYKFKSEDVCNYFGVLQDLVLNLYQKEVSNLELHCHEGVYTRCRGASRTVNHSVYYDGFVLSRIMGVP